MKIAFAVAAVALWAHTAFAVQTKPKPTIIQEPGKPVLAVWPSGNKAEMVLARLTPALMPVEFEVTENLCTQSVGHKFTLKVGVRFDLMQWQWSEHTDGERVGKPVMITFPDGMIMMPISVGLFMSGGSRYIDPRLAEGLPDDEIEFQGSVGWLPGMSDGVLRRLEIQSWNSETMARNSQTGAIENRIVSGEIGPRLEPLPGQKLKARLVHDDTGGFFSSVFNHGFYLFGDVVSWVFPAQTGNCFIGFKPDIGSANAMLTDYLTKSKFELKPYIMGSDGLAEVVLPLMRADLEKADE